MLGDLGLKLEPTTTECVENIFERILPDVEFVSTGMMKFEILSKFFGKQTLGGSHPNCESATLVISDGEKFSSSFIISQYSSFRSSLKAQETGQEANSEIACQIGPDMAAWWFNLSAAVQAAFIVARTINLRKSLAKPVFLNGIKALVDIASGQKD